MRPCWELEPLKRPTFHRISKTCTKYGRPAIDNLTQVETSTKATLAAISAGKVPYNGTNNVSVGPGASGKTQTRYSITGKGMMTERASTAGGDQERLLIQLKQGSMIAFDILDDRVDLLERAAWYCQNHSEELEADSSDAMERLFLIANNNSNNSSYDQVRLESAVFYYNNLACQGQRPSPQATGRTTLGLRRA